MPNNIQEKISTKNDMEPDAFQLLDEGATNTKEATGNIIDFNRHRHSKIGKVALFNEKDKLAA